MTSITIPAQTIPAQSIPATITVKAETVPAQTVALPNSGAAVGTYGDATHVAQVSVNAQGIVTAASSIPIASGGIGTAPDFATALQAAADAGKFLDWTWGNVALTAPLVINLTKSTNGIGLDMHGASISPATGFPAGADGLTFLCPTTNAFMIARGLSLRGFTIAGFPGNNLVLSSPLGASAIRAPQIQNVVSLAAGKSGVLLSGAVFEGDIIALVSGSNGAHGLELHQPAQASGYGVLSSINIWGGTFHDNKLSGIGATADVAYQEAQGWYPHGAQLINNGGPGIRGCGMALADGCHFEANCQSATTESQAGVFMYGGTVNLTNCDGTDNSGHQKYLLDIQSPGASKVSIVKGCGVWDQGSGYGMKLAKLGAAGTIWTDRPWTAADFDGNGQWLIVEPTATTRAV